MLDAARNLQKEAVEKLAALALEAENPELTCKAPTGSGKTWIMSAFMDKVLAERNDVVFLVVSLSKSDLARQNHEKFVVYGGQFPNIRPHLIESKTDGEGRLHIDDKHNVYSLPRDLYKEKAKLNKGPFVAFLERMRSQGKEIWLVRDESHQATNRLGELSDQYFPRIFNFSATPKLRRGQLPDVEIKDDEAVMAKLIKKITLGHQEDDLEKALRKFVEVQGRYAEAAREKSFGEPVRPCMIIQISNADQAEAEFRKIRNTLARSEFKDLQWMMIVENKGKSKGDTEIRCESNNRIRDLPISSWKDEAKRNSSPIDIIIFKMVITEGWDIPRACMLYQIRDAKSAQLTEQVVGRVRRNPKLLDFERLPKSAQELVTEAWVWGVMDSKVLHADAVKFAGDQDAKGNKIRNELILKTTEIITPDKDTSFDVGELLDNVEHPVLVNSEDCEPVFSLYRRYTQMPNDVRELCRNYVKSYGDWLHFNNYALDIEKKALGAVIDYKKSMRLADGKKSCP